MIVILSCVWSLNCCIWIYISSAFLHVTLVWLWFFFNFLLSFMLVLTRLDLAGNDAVSLSANHLQKLRFSFQLTTPHGHVFKPNQVCSRLLDLLNECHFNAVYWGICCSAGVFQVETWDKGWTHLCGWKYRQEVWESSR